MTATVNAVSSNIETGSPLDWPVGEDHDGDLIIAFVEGNDSDVSDGSGLNIGLDDEDFQLLKGVENYGNGSSGALSLGVWGTVADAGLAEGLTISGATFTRAAGVWIHGHGVTSDFGAPPTLTGLVIGSTTNHGTSTSNLLAPSITTVVNDCLVLVVMMFRDDANDTTNVSGVTNANLSGLTKLIDESVSATGGAGGGLAIWSGVKATAGSVGTTEWDHDTAVRSVSFQMAIPPAISTKAIVVGAVGLG